MNLDACLSGIRPLMVVKEDLLKKGCNCTIYCSPATLCKAAANMLEAGFHLEDIATLDALEGYAITYAFAHYAKSERLHLRVIVPHDAPSVPSISAIFSGADWHERESADFYGIDFTGHPNLIRLLLPSDMDSAPLRKKDAARVALCKLFPPGPDSIVSRDEKFTLFDPEPAESPKTAQAAAKTPSGESPASVREG